MRDFVKVVEKLRPDILKMPKEKRMALSGHVWCVIRFLKTFAVTALPKLKRA